MCRFGLFYGGEFRVFLRRHLGPCLLKASVLIAQIIITCLPMSLFISENTLRDGRYCQSAANKGTEIMIISY